VHTFFPPFKLLRSEREHRTQHSSNNGCGSSASIERSICSNNGCGSRGGSTATAKRNSRHYQRWDITNSATLTYPLPFAAARRVSASGRPGLRIINKAPRHPCSRFRRRVWGGASWQSAGRVSEFQVGALKQHDEESDEHRLTQKDRGDVLVVSPNLGAAELRGCAPALVVGSGSLPEDMPAVVLARPLSREPTTLGVHHKM
jgi:hypothetical protein